MRDKGWGQPGDVGMWGNLGVGEWQLDGRGIKEHEDSGLGGTGELATRDPLRTYRRVEFLELGLCSERWGICGVGSGQQCGWNPERSQLKTHKKENG